MKRFAWIGALTVVMIGGFQNCSKLSSSKLSENSSLSHQDPHIMRTSSVESINTDISFGVHDEALAPSAQFNWTYTMNGGSAGCTVKSAANSSQFVINCSAEGTLKVMVEISEGAEQRSLTYLTNLALPAAPGDQIPLNVTFEIKSGNGGNSWNSAATIVETFVGQTLKIKNSDSVIHQLHTGGRPCGHGAEIQPGATSDCVISQTYNRAQNGNLYDHNLGGDFFVVAYSGQALYQANCASCHGALASSTVLNKKVSEIFAARTSVPTMIQNAAVQGLTRRQIEAISFALGAR